MSENQIQKFSERLKQIVIQLDSNGNAFARTLGYDRSDTVNNAMNGRNLPNTKLLMDIATTYPEVNLDWLITGRGKPILEKGEEVEYQEPDPAEKNKEPEYDGVLNGVVDEPGPIYDRVYKQLYEQCRENIGTKDEMIALLKDQVELLKRGK